MHIVKAKLFEIAHGRLVHLVIATSVADAIASIDSKVMGQKVARKMANVIITGNSMGLTSYEHDRHDLPPNFGNSAKLSDNVYNCFLSA
jgi:hypothetical protein